MLRFSKLVVGVVFAAGIFVVPTVAQAETIKFIGVGNASTVTIGGSIAANYHGTVQAGEYNWSWVGTAPAGFAQSFYSYCVDLSSFVQAEQTVTPVSTSGFTNGVANGGAKAAWLFNEYAAGIHSLSNATTAAINAAALQIAIWEAMYDTTSNLGYGGFTATAANTQVTTQATSYLSALYSSQPWTAVATVLSTDKGQDQIVRQVSEPSTLIMVGLAFFASPLWRGGQFDSRNGSVLSSQSGHLGDRVPAFYLVQQDVLSRY